MTTKVDVIIPVYGQEALVRACIRSVRAARCRTAYELIIVDDASPEPRLLAWLDAQARVGRITLLRQSENRGFVAAVNIGMALHPDRDVVLLNSDTLVFRNWLDRLSAASLSRNRVASVTPFSNNATICSYPAYPEGGQLPTGWSAKRLDRLCSSVLPLETVTIPTAVGFCMYISRSSMNRVGYFDAEAFGMGYGEENDFCMRASEAGYVHLLDASTYVYHAGGASFNEGAEALKRNAQAVIDRRWPHYNSLVAEFIGRDPIRPLRERLDRTESGLTGFFWRVSGGSDQCRRVKQSPNIGSSLSGEEG